MARDLDINSILSSAYRSIDPALLEGKQEYFQAISQVALKAIMDDPSLKVGTGKLADGLSEVAKAHGFETPKLEAPKSKKLSGDQIVKLMLKLQLETAEQSAEINQKTLEEDKKALERRFQDQVNKLNKNIKAMEKAAGSSTIMQALGWLGVGVAVIAAVAVSIVTLGAAAAPAAAGVSAAASSAAGASAGAAGAGAAAGAAGAGAAGAAGAAATGAALSTKAAVGLALSWTSTLLAITQQTLSQTGTMEEITKSLSEKLRSGTDNKSKANADLFAQLILGGAFMIGALGSGMTGGALTAGAKAVDTAAKIGSESTKLLMQKVTFGVTTAMTAMSIGAQAYNIDAQYATGMASADVTESKAATQYVQQLIEETQEELQQIIESIEDMIAKMFDMLNSANETSKQIAQQMAQMA